MGRWNQREGKKGRKRGKKGQNKEIGGRKNGKEEKKEKQIMRKARNKNRRKAKNVQTGMRNYRVFAPLITGVTPILKRRQHETRKMG